MGLDEALLHSAATKGIATLRLYSWQGPWLSLGYAQRHFPADQVFACEGAGVGVVRRTTGGRAVLHGCDLTYSVAAPEAMLRPGLRNSYDQVATALLAAIRSLGAVGASRVPEHRAAANSKAFDCFAAPAGDEIVVGAHKLVGSAQRRRGGAVLQHGSIRMTADLPEHAKLTGIDPGVSTCLTDVGLTVGEDDLRAALVSAFGQVLGADLSEARTAEPSELEQAELRVALHRDDRLAAPSSRTV
jgi:lipoate-protein ligase A